MNRWKNNKQNNDVNERIKKANAKVKLYIFFFCFPVTFFQVITVSNGFRDNFDRFMVFH